MVGSHCSVTLRRGTTLYPGSSGWSPIMMQRPHPSQTKFQLCVAGTTIHRPKKGKGGPGTPQADFGVTSFLKGLKPTDLALLLCGDTDVSLTPAVLECLAHVVVSAQGPRASGPRL